MQFLLQYHNHSGMASKNIAYFAKTAIGLKKTDGRKLYLLIQDLRT